MNISLFCNWDNRQLLLELSKFCLDCINIINTQFSPSTNTKIPKTTFSPQELHDTKDLKKIQPKLKISFPKS